MSSLRGVCFRLAMVALLVSALFGAVITHAQDTQMANEIRVSVVAGAMQDTMTKLVDKYEAANPGVNVTLELEPEGGTFQALFEPAPAFVGHF